MKLNMCEKQNLSTALHVCEKPAETLMKRSVNKNKEKADYKTHRITSEVFLNIYSFGRNKH